MHLFPILWILCSSVWALHWHLAERSGWILAAIVAFGPVGGLLSIYSTSQGENTLRDSPTSSSINGWSPTEISDMVTAARLEGASADRAFCLAGAVIARWTPTEAEAVFDQNPVAISNEWVRAC